jgi:nucleolar protein 58
MHHLVPGEELELAKEDRLQMSKGMKKVLDDCGFDVKPEMVSSLQHLLFHVLTRRA